MLSPQDLALAYDRHVAAFCREDVEGAMSFATWLAAFWVQGSAGQPAAYPNAVSFLGGAGRGICWYGTDSAIVGYARGWSHGCYRVPASAVLPYVRPIGASSEINTDMSQRSPASRSSL